MGKRFTDTDKWKKPFIKSLPCEYKLFWLFLLDECDNSGVWHVELEIAEVRLGIKLSLEKIRGFFKERIVEFDGGAKMFIPDFINFQYGSLSESNNAHKGVIKTLNRYNLWGLVSPSRGAMDKDKDMDKDMDKDKEGEVFFSIEHCAVVALNDDRWVKANSADEKKLMEFNAMLEKQAIYNKNPKDYKQHFANWSKGKSFKETKPKKTYEELMEQARLEDLKSKT